MLLVVGELLLLLLAELPVWPILDLLWTRGTGPGLLALRVFHPLLHGETLGACTEHTPSLGLSLSVPHSEPSR